MEQEAKRTAVHEREVVETLFGLAFTSAGVVTREVFQADGSAKSVPSSTGAASAATTTSGGGVKLDLRLWWKLGARVSNLN